MNAQTSEDTGYMNPILIELPNLLGVFVASVLQPHVKHAC